MNLIGGQERATALAAAALLAVVLLWGLSPSAGDGPADEPSGQPRTYTPPLLSKPEFVRPEEGYYFSEKSRDIFGIERGVGNIRLPALPLPVPFPSSLAFPHFLPVPGVIGRPPVFLVEGKNEQRPTAADLISETDFSVLAKMEEKEEKTVYDRRNEKERDRDAVWVKGQEKPREGEIKYEDKEIVILVGNMGREEIKRADIAKIEYDYTMEERYRILTRAVRPGDGDGRVKLSQWCRDLGMTPEALDEMKRAVEEQGQSLHVVLAAAAFYRETGDYDAEMSTYRAAIESIPAARADLLCRLGDLFSMLGMTEHALDAYRRSVEIAPLAVDGAVKEGLILARTGSHARAAEVFKKVSDPSGKRAGDIAFGLALCAFGAGDIASAETQMSNARKAWGNAVTAEALNLSGVVKVIRKKYKEAVADFRAALAADQYRTEAWYNLALCYILAGKIDEGQILLGKAAERDPMSADVLNGLALCSWLVNSAEDARTLWKSAVNLDPDNGYGLYALGFIALSDAQLEEARGYFLESLRIDYAYDPLFYHAALCSYYDENYDEAEAIVRRRQSDPACRLLTGCIALARNDPSAEEIFKSLVDPLGNTPLLWNCRGYIEYHRAGTDPNLRMARAKEYFAKAQQTDVQDEYAKSALAKIVRFETTRMFEDTFDRDDGPTVGNGWAESDSSFGLQAAIEKGRCVLSGVQKVKDDGVTSIERETLSKQFQSLELTLIPDRVAGAESGIRFFYGKGSGSDMEGLEIGIDRKGNIVAGSARTREDQGRLAPLVPPMVADRPLAIRIDKVIVDDDKEEFHITINGTALKPFKRSQGVPDNYLLVIWTKAKIGTEVTLAVDDVRIYEKK